MILDHLDECLLVGDWSADVVECSGAIGNAFVRERARANSVGIIIFVSLINYPYANFVEFSQSFVDLNFDILKLKEVFELPFCSRSVSSLFVL